MARLVKMSKVLRLNTEQKYLSIPKDVPYIVTVAHSNSTVVYAGSLNSNLDPVIVPETASWAVSADDNVLFSSDNQLMEFADA